MWFAAASPVVLLLSLSRRRQEGLPCPTHPTNGQRRGSTPRVIQGGRDTETTTTTCSFASSLPRRRDVLWQAATAATVLATFPANAADGATVSVTLQSPQDRLGLELYPTTLRGKPIVAIRRNIANQQAFLQPGMILQDYETVDTLKAKMQFGPYPLTLTFRNLAAAGDAMADNGLPLVTAQDALTLAQQTNDDSSAATATGAQDNFQIQVLNDPKPTCSVQSRRNDVLEINYVASYTNQNNNKRVIYDASENRGTGQPYQMVLGSGDMLPGVDLSLYQMCPGERRRVTIPPRLAYGARGNRLFDVPPNATLEWEVQLIRINGVVDETDPRTRDEMEGRAAYSR